MKKSILACLLVILAISGIATALIPSTENNCTIELRLPTNNDYTQDTTPEMHFNTTNATTGGLPGGINCSIWIKQATASYAINGDGIKVLGTNTSLTITTALASDNYVWYVVCENTTAGFVGNCSSATRTLRVGSMQYEGIDQLWKFIKDAGAVIIALVPLLILIGVIAIVGFVLVWLRGFFRGKKLG